MSFIFSLSNYRAYWLKKQCFKYQEPCIYVLYGESGSGKSTFLRDIFTERNDYIFFTCEKLKELMLSAINGTYLLDLEMDKSPNRQYIVFENMEDISTVGEGTTIWFEQLLNTLCAHDKTVFISECNNQPIKLKVEYQVLNIKFNRTKTTRRIIKHLAAKHCKKLDEITIKRLLSEYRFINGLEKRIMRLD